jgi:heterodisulfide reductase subunit C/nitrate reductase gamma subunit
MVYTILMYIALTVFGVGLIYKTAGWFRFSIGSHTPDMTPSVRIRAAWEGFSSVLFSRKLWTLIKASITDVLLQNHIREQDTLRWLMHMLMFAGFTFLLFTHALGNIIHTSLFDKYYLALNPYLLVSGGMVLAGVAIAAYRRIVLKVRGFKTNSMDCYLLILLAVILLSGIAMESTKLTSYVYYQNFWDIHFLACMLGLAYLPFSKLFHIVTTPLSLMARAVMDENSDPLNIHTRRALALDACMHCGNCTSRCSVAVAYDSLGNEEILPSERMIFLKEYIAYKDIDARGLAAIQQGIYLCTNCDRCTVICPAGIDLRDLWFSVREEVIQRGHCVPLMLTPFSFYRGLRRPELDPEQYEQPLRKAQNCVTDPFELVGKTDAVIPLTPANREFAKTAGLSGPIGTYSFCFACENCSTVCPVVGNYENPQQALDLLPHQIIRAVGLGQGDLAKGSRMLWYCLTCYQCQEHCPQGVKVTDIFYKLKNLAVMEADCASAPKGCLERADR